MHDEPLDPFRGRPQRPGTELDAWADDGLADPLTEADRQDVLEDLADLEVYQALLEPDRHPRARDRV